MQADGGGTLPRRDRRVVSRRPPPAHCHYRTASPSRQLDEDLHVLWEAGKSMRVHLCDCLCVWATIGRGGFYQGMNLLQTGEGSIRG
jgi:hypothetical protein